MDVDTKAYERLKARLCIGKRRAVTACNERWITNDYASEDELSQLALDNERWITHDYASEDELSQLALD
jgi:hypothetical protein